MLTARCDDAIALLHLLAASGGSAPRRRLLERHGTPAAALAAGSRAWRDAGLNAAQTAALRNAQDTPALARTLAWLQAPQHALIGWHDPDYPPLLRRIPNPPLALFVAGDASLLCRPAIAVVGSRAATVGGCDNAHAFARAFAQAGLLVVSGLAAGIDTAAHRGALAVQDGHTAAVLGTGPDIAYPRENAGLLRQIGERGVAISEHPPGTAPQRQHFPSRNRLLAGLCLGTVVIEAALRSGALITARQAADAGREVFALPGSIHNPQARGCHRLLREGAMLAETPQEVLEALRPAVGEWVQNLRNRYGIPIPMQEPIQAVSVEPAPLDPEHQKLWEALEYDPIPMDHLVERTGLTAARLSAMLLTLELDGRIAVEHGRYARRHHA